MANTQNRIFNISIGIKGNTAITSNLKDMTTDFAFELYGRIFTCCSLLRGFLTERQQRMDISIKFKLKGYSVYCNIDGEGNIHCRFSSKLRTFNGEFKDLIGKGSTLSISRGGWMEGIFTGTIELNAASIEACF